MVMQSPCPLKIDLAELDRRWADPLALLSSPERLRGLVAALTRMRRDTSRYESLLKTMH